MSVFAPLHQLVKALYVQEAATGMVPLHAPCLGEAEKQALNACIDSGFVSSVGQQVTAFEQAVAKWCGCDHGVATVNGTSALHLALHLAGAKPGTEVLTQALSFVATANAIDYTGAQPVFLDVHPQTWSLDADELEMFLRHHTGVVDGQCVNRESGRVIVACVPMHTLGRIGQMPRIRQLCDEFQLYCIEDAAEALGSALVDKHGQRQSAGSFGHMAAISFNGNKIVTAGGGGALVTQDAQLAQQAKHLSTTAKVAHAYRFEHDAVGFNYRLPNVNAALGLAQLGQLSTILRRKQAIAQAYRRGLQAIQGHFPPHRLPLSDDMGEYELDWNTWLIPLRFSCVKDAKSLLDEGSGVGIQYRPFWTPMNQLSMYAQCQTFGDLEVTENLATSVVCLPSGVPCDP